MNDRERHEPGSGWDGMATDLETGPKRQGVAAQRRTPALSLVLGYGAMVPFAAGAVAAWLLEGNLAAVMVSLTVVWGGAILAFLGGVRRGLSFRHPGGPTSAQLAAMLWLFCLGLAALLSPWPSASLVLLILGFLSLGILDPWAAQRGEVPLFFVRLRPIQMLIPIVSLAALLLR